MFTAQCGCEWGEVGAGAAGTLIDPSGQAVRRVGSGDGWLPDDPVDGAGRQRVLADLMGTSSTNLCTFGDILRTMERLGFVDRRGAPPGFLNTLPKGVLFESAVEALNLSHVQSLKAARIDFPLIFDGERDDMRQLTERYERQDRTFRLADPDGRHRLAYAADPGLFSWLRGRRLATARLPYAVYTPQPAFRRRRTGEHSLRALRQYPLPDLHVICLRRDAQRIYIDLVAASAALARFLFGEAWAQFVETIGELDRREPRLGAAAAVAAEQYTVHRQIDRQTSYYSLKGGINVDAGAGTLMLFNFQWDEVNPVRFGIRCDGGPLVVIHATASGALAKVLPLIVGRGLSGLAPRAMPVELSPVQVVVLPVDARHRPSADAAVDHLEGLGFRAALGSERGSIGSRIRELRSAWNPYHAVVGDREAGGAPLQFRSPVGAVGGAPEQVLAEYGARLDACRIAVDSLRLDVPFA